MSFFLIPVLLDPLDSLAQIIILVVVAVETIPLLGPVFAQDSKIMLDRLFDIIISDVAKAAPALR